ncbi:pyrimidodiazepine synthase-like [Nymphalis io]|uniref:pyrimidodiazepine synthase-like n=1 Tax=Inachis io TaxID=171585 RepID=UPI0021670CAD|nr:pyrimidodiazepine synthase-like [Nymphalis io]
MIMSTLSFAMHILVSSYKVLAPVGQLLEYVLPYRNMAAKAITGSINFNTKHLKKGDPLPPYNGKLRIYNMRYCPYAQRTILALNAKQIDYEVVNINLVEKPEWLIRKSALGKVPSIEIKEDVCIYESLITVEYLDEVYPQRPLLPKDPVKKAFDKITVETTGAIQTIFFKAVTAPDTITDETVKAYHRALKFIEDQLKSRDTTFLGGAEPGYADYMIWPWFERVQGYKNGDHRIKIDPLKYPLLMQYIDNMLKDPAVSQYLIPNDIMEKFVNGYKLGCPNYELLNEN